MLEGNTESCPLYKVVELVLAAHYTGRIAITFEGGARGYIYCKEGELLNARGLGEERERAFFALMTRQKGHFSFEPNVPIPIRLFNTPTSKLLTQARMISTVQNST